jgi:hypothetical protein
MKLPPLAGCFLAFLTLASLAQAVPESRDYAWGHRRVRFGVNGHPLNSGSYEQMPLEQQLSLLKSIGLRTYRVNINPEHTEKLRPLSQLATLAERQGIRILPVVIIPPGQYSDEGQAFAAAQSAMYELAKEFDSRIEVWELGNEYDLYCVKPGTNGGSPGDYADQKYAVVRGLVRGMLEGLREASPTARSIVETTQHTSQALDNGFLQRLMDDGVRFDITGYHYYSRDGRIPVNADGNNSLQVLYDQFHKPIWVTEFDESAISPETGPSSNPPRQGEALRVAMNELASAAGRYHVVGADIYELLNEPQLLDTPGVAPCQGQFGILRADGRATAASRDVQQFLKTYGHEWPRRRARSVIACLYAV